MKLLIVDDEINTRKGIVNRLPLQEIGITEVCVADDGVNGLKAASAFDPDIILTDVRMPRMDGVEMIYKIKELNPSCQVIFMSGYSDKEYLKSAIDLKAVRYIEKPINLNELKNALQISVSLREKENINKKLVETSISLIKSELALQLISRSSYLPGIMQNIRAASRYIPEDGLFATILLRVNTDISSESVDSFKMIFENIMEKINEITKLSGIWARNKEEFIVHLYADQNSRHLFTEEKLENVCRMILDETVSYFPVFLALGDIVTGIQNVYRTYESAVIAIQRAFYCGYNSIIKSGDVCIPPYQFSSKKINDFSKLLDDEDNQINAEFFIKSLSMDIKRYDTTPVNECKDYYYRLLLELVNASEKYGIKLEDVPALNTDIWAKFLNFSTIFEMESFLLKQINVYYQSIEEKKNTTARLLQLLSIYTNIIMMKIYQLRLLASIPIFHRLI